MRASELSAWAICSAPDRGPTCARCRAGRREREWISRDTGSCDATTHARVALSAKRRRHDRRDASMLAVRRPWRRSGRGRAQARMPGRSRHPAHIGPSRSRRPRSASGTRRPRSVGKHHGPGNSSLARISRFGTLTPVSALGQIVGPVVGGVIIGHTDSELGEPSSALLSRHGSSSPACPATASRCEPACRCRRCAGQGRTGCGVCCADAGCPPR